MSIRSIWVYSTTGNDPKRLLLNWNVERLYVLRSTAPIEKLFHVLPQIIDEAEFRAHSPRKAIGTFGTSAFVEETLESRRCSTAF